MPPLASAFLILLLSYLIGGLVPLLFFVRNFLRKLEGEPPAASALAGGGLTPGGAGV